MIMGRSLGHALRALLAGAAIAVAPAAKAETVTVGMVGAVSSTHWPVYIGLTKGYFAAEDLKLDLVFIQSSAALVQQLTAGSLDLALSTGLADPIRAIDKGSAIAIVRIEMQAPPYALLAKPAIKHWSDLKGKTISIGGPKDITRIYLERMAGPNGVKPGDYDTVFAGATSARFSALQAGGVDAALLLPPFNFYADRRASPISASPSTMPANCRSPERWSAATGRRRTRRRWQRCCRSTTRAWPGFPTRRIAPRQSRSWWTQAGSRSRTSRSPTTFSTPTNFSKIPGRSPAPRWARCSRRSKRSAT